jgi:hypothetical protein
MHIDRSQVTVSTNTRMSMLMAPAGTHAHAHARRQQIDLSRHVIQQDVHEWDADVTSTRWYVEVLPLLHLVSNAARACYANAYVTAASSTSLALTSVSYKKLRSKGANRSENSAA